MFAGGKGIFNSAIAAVALGLGVGLVAFLVCAGFVRSALRNPNSGANGNGARLLPTNTNNNGSPDHLLKDKDNDLNRREEAEGENNLDLVRPATSKQNGKRVDFAVISPTRPDALGSGEPDVLPPRSSRKGAELFEQTNTGELRKKFSVSLHVHSPLEKLRPIPSLHPDGMGGLLRDKAFNSQTRPLRFQRVQEGIFLILSRSIKTNLVVKGTTFAIGESFS